MQILKYAVFAWLAALCPASAGNSLSLEGAVQFALLNNRELAAARFAIAQAHGRLRQAGLLPNPDLDFSGMSGAPFGAAREGSFTVGLSQRFPLTAQLSLAREVRRVEVAQALREVRNQERLLIARVQKLYVAVKASGWRAQAAGVAQESASASRDLAAQRVEAGQGSLAESGLARVAERRWWNEAQNARTAAESALLDLRTALGLPSGANLEVTESLDAIVGRLRRPVPRVAHRPDVELALLEIDRAGADVRLARAEAWEGIRVGLDYVYDHAVDEPEGLGTSQFLGVRVSIPLPVWDRKSGLVEQRAASRDEAVARVKALELEVQNSIASAARRVAMFDEQRRQYQATAATTLAETDREMTAGFDQGRVDLRDLLLVRAEASALRVEAIAITRNLADALIELQLAAGSHPEISRPYLEETASATTTDKQ